MLESRNPAMRFSLLCIEERENVPHLLKQGYLNLLPSHASMLNSRELPNRPVKVSSESYQVDRLSLLQRKVYHVALELSDTQ